MPMFEFTCRKCRTDFEELCTSAQIEAGEVTCPECGAQDVEKKLSTFASSAPSAGGGGGGGGCGTGGFG